MDVENCAMSEWLDFADGIGVSETIQSIDLAEAARDTGFPGNGNPVRGAAS